MKMAGDRHFSARQIDTAIAWHEGGQSPLYLFVTTGAVQGPEHRANLLAELDRCLRELNERWPEGAERDLEERCLKSLRKAIARVQLD